MTKLLTHIINMRQQDAISTVFTFYLGFTNVRSFHSSSLAQRSYEQWVRLAKIHSFTPEEVLEASELGEYVVVDPANKTTLLSLSKLAYEKLLGQCLSNETVLILLLSPLDKKTPQNGEAEASNTSQPTPPSSIESNLFTSAWHYVQKELQNSRSPAMTKVRKSSFSAFYGIGVPRVDGRLAGSGEQIARIIQRWGSRLLFWSGMSRSRAFRRDLFFFVRFLKVLFDTQGPYGVVIYFKASLFIINSFLSGNPVSSGFLSTGVPVRLRGGLPAFLPLRWRRAIRRNDLPLIRFVVSLIYSYRALHATCASKWEKSLQTITAQLPAPSWRLEDFSVFCKKFYRANGIIAFSDAELTPTHLFTSIAASSLSPLSVMGLGAETYIWNKMDELGVTKEKSTPLRWLESLNNEGSKRILDRLKFWESSFLQGKLDLAYTVGDPKSSKEALDAFIAKHPSFADDLTSSAIGGSINVSRTVSPISKEDVFRLIESGHFPVGRLHRFWSAGGKVRVIAIFDSVRQTVLQPVHDLLMRLLRKFPGDATFDQAGAVRSLARLKFRDYFSYDLSAATDMIPQTLYKAVLQPLLESRYEDWLNLMVDYPFYILGKGADRVMSFQNGVKLSYTRGQPMGGLSSWASLAVLHHMLVQYAWFIWRDRMDPLAEYEVPYTDIFSQYRILGDDVVIAHSGVAEVYVELCRDFEIPLSIGKSFISSNGFFNFASESFLNGQCISPLSLLEDFSSSSLSSRNNFGLKALERGWKHSGNLCEGHLKFIIPKSRYYFELALARSGVLSPIARRLHALLAVSNVSTTAGISLPSWARSLWDSSLAQRSMFKRVRYVSRHDLVFVHTTLTLLIDKYVEQVRDLVALPLGPYSIQQLAFQEWGLKTHLDAILAELERVQRLGEKEFIPTPDGVRELYDIFISLLMLDMYPKTQVSRGPLAYFVAMKYAASGVALLPETSPKLILKELLREEAEVRAADIIVKFTDNHRTLKDIFLRSSARKSFWSFYEPVAPQGTWGGPPIIDQSIFAPRETWSSRMIRWIKDVLGGG